SSTPSWSTMIFFTRSATGSMRLLRGSPRSPLSSGFETPAPVRILHVKAAVHAQDLSGNVRGGLRAQEDDGPGHVLRPAHPAERNGGGDRFACLFGHRRGHVRLDEARGH